MELASLGVMKTKNKKNMGKLWHKNCEGINYFFFVVFCVWRSNKSSRTRRCSLSISFQICIIIITLVHMLRPTVFWVEVIVIARLFWNRISIIAAQLCSCVIKDNLFIFLCFLCIDEHSLCFSLHHFFWLIFRPKHLSESV